MLKALMVDLDGTLADTADANYRAYAAALAEAGVEVDRAEFDAEAEGRNWRRFLPVFLGPDRAAEAASVAARKTALYGGMLDHVRINQGLVRLIESFAPVGPAALVTTASRKSVEAILAHHDLARLFRVVITGDEVTRHKPDPEPVHHALERLGADVADAVLVGDSPFDLRAGRAAGVATIGVTWGFFERPALEHEGPDVVVDTPEELRKELGLR